MSVEIVITYITETPAKHNNIKEENAHFKHREEQHSTVVVSLRRRCCICSSSSSTQQEERRWGTFFFSYCLTTENMNLLKKRFTITE